MSGPSCDYHGRVDFRAFDVIVHAIDNASPAELARAIETAGEYGASQTIGPRKRLLWRALHGMLTLYQRKYAAASTSEHGRI